MTLKPLEDLPEEVLGIEVQGQLSAQSYRELLLPLLHQHVQRHGGLRLLCVLQDDFHGMTAGAMLQDLLTGIRYGTYMSRMALVCNIAWIRRTVRIFGPLAPCPCRVFRPDEFEQAKEWIVHGLKLDYTLDADSGILTVQPQTALAPEPFTRLSAIVAAHCAQHGKLKGLIVDTRRFPFWQGAGGLRGHLRFLRRHRSQVEKIALVTDSPLGRAAEFALPSLFALAVRRFPYGEIEAAQKWISAVPEDETPPAT